MFLSKIFGRRKEKYDAQDYDQSEYAKLQTESIVEELNLSDEAQAKRYVIDLCEQMIAASRELEDARSVYDLVTYYLTDIQIIEELTEAERAPILDCAMHVAKLDRERNEFLKTKRKLTETQFAQMQEEEDHLPVIIRRLRDNERYMDAVKKDLTYLEGQKLQWAILRNESVQAQKNLGRAARYLLVLTATVFAMILAGAWYFQFDRALPLTIAAFVAVLAGTYVLVRYQDAAKDIRRADVNRNHAISLENHVKIKFVNIKNAVDYTCEKYHTRNSQELEYVFEQYQDEAREKEKFRKTSDDLDYYSKSLVQYLTRLRMYDARVWINRANAIVDSREMVELKHNLIERRQKLRARMEYQIQIISDMKKEARRNIDRIGTAVRRLSRSSAKLNPSIQHYRGTGVVRFFCFAKKFPFCHILI